MKLFKFSAFKALVFLFLPGCLTFVACESKDNKNQVLSVYKPGVQIYRADELLAKATDENARDLYKQIQGMDSTFALVYANQILRTSPSDLSAESSVIERYLKEPGIKQLVDTSMVLYPDLKQESKEFAVAFDYFKTLFPGKAIPKVIACNTDMTLAAFTVGDSVLAFSTDLFLGKDFPGYDQQYPKYVSRTFTREHILPKSMTSWVQNFAGVVPENGNLLDQMLYHGKVLAAVKRLLPDTPDSLILEYTSDQTAWVQNSEAPIWAYLTKDNLLYNSDWRSIQKLVNPSPNSPGMPQEAPGRTANYIGWKIIEAYLKKHPGTTFDALFQISDGQKILQESGYHPARN